MTSPRHPEDGPDDAEVDRAFREIVAGLRATEAPRRPRPEESRQQRPEGQGGQRPESRGQRPEAPGGQRPEGLGGQRPETPGGQRPEGLGGERPVESRGQRPEAPRRPRPQEPRAPRAEDFLNPPLGSPRAQDRPNPPPRQPPPRHLGHGTPEGMATDHRSYEPPEEDDHFIPPDPPPLPAGDLHFWAIVAGLTIGPLLVLFSAVIPVLADPWALIGLLLSIAGFVLLVLRQPRHRGPDDGTHGAQV